jgi:hypothetical protein
MTEEGQGMVRGYGSQGDGVEGRSGSLVVLLEAFLAGG